ncbi:MAG: N-6 DNA methylase [Eubacteriaceae bacterium]|nr:N-6 DNA methylase [Eubacteriaceae bacterium]
MKNPVDQLELNRYFRAQMNNDGMELIIKAVLLKYLSDNAYLDPENIKPDLFEEFTFQNIIRLWDREAELSFQEDTLISCKAEAGLIMDYVDHGYPLKGLDSILMGTVYEELSSAIDQKKKGMFYTPEYTVELMLSLDKKCRIKGSRAIDPACGSGFFLSAVYDRMEDSYEEITDKDDDTKRLRMHKDILENRIYGMDSDSLGLLIASLVLSLKYKKFVLAKNLICTDSLMEGSAAGESFDLVAGNPPYIGHKQLGREYFIDLKEKYGSVFYDKADISYCFFVKAFELLKDGGQLIFITSRYFLEAHNAKGLRRFLMEKYVLNSIIDYNGLRIIPGARVDLAIIEASKTESGSKKDYMNVHRYIGGRMNKNHFDQSARIYDQTLFNIFTTSQESLNHEVWVLKDQTTSSIIHKLETAVVTPLEGIWDCYQGIITGLDKAFVIKREEKDSYEQFAVNWIKNSNVKSFRITESSKYLIFADKIQEIKDYPCLEKRLEGFRERLENRRECKNGSKKWFHLQWGRKETLFKEPKIIFPYKASGNRFALDTSGKFFSADIYGFALKKNLFNEMSLEGLTCLLNSELYEFYFKAIGKKLGNDMYEYYPNTVGKLKIPSSDPIFWEKLSEFYLEMSKDAEENVQSVLMNEFIYACFKITEEEKTYIKNTLKGNREND